MQGLVSIIVPVYNAAPYIEKCLRSLIAQDYENIEIIVVDDGSTDGSGDVVEQLAFEKVRLIRQPNGGVSRARNTGIRAAHGEYILFIDGDDWVDCNHVSTLVAPLGEGFDGVMVRISFDNEDGTPQFSDDMCRYYQPDEIIESADFNILFDAHQLGSPCDKIYKREIIETAGIYFDEKISYAEDFVFNLTYLKHLTRVKRLHIPTYHYVKHQTSSSFRYHANAPYIALQICEAASKTIHKSTFAGKLIYQKHFLWAIINLFHKDCPLSWKEKTSELRALLKNPLFASSSEAIGQLPISRPLKMILRMRIPILLYLAFSIRK